MSFSETVAAPEAAPRPGTLNISDIQNAIRVIDYAAEQGAFRGWQTIEQVMVIRNRMNEFIKSVVPATSNTTNANGAGMDGMNGTNGLGTTVAR